MPLDQGIAYDNMRCKVWYDTVNMGREYVVRRHTTGLVNGKEEHDMDKLYRVSYRAASGDVIAPNTSQSIREACLGRGRVLDRSRASGS